MKQPSILTACRAALIPLLLAAMPANSHADTPLKIFLQGCGALSAGRQNPDSQTAKLIIRSWLDGVRAAAAFNWQSGLDSSPLSEMFPEAGGASWCAGSLSGFIQNHASEFPDTATAEEILPLWWAMVHPHAEAEHKKAAGERLEELRLEKERSMPPRRTLPKAG